MKSLFAICSMLLITITATSFNSIKDPDTLKLKCNDHNYEECVLLSQLTSEVISGPLEIKDITVYEIEEDVNLDFDTIAYLPSDFNPLKGIGDLDWNAIELLEIEEKVSLGFETKQYLPADFNALKGIGDLDWSKIELIKLEEEVDINFSSKLYLPVNFDSREGI